MNVKRFSQTAWLGSFTLALLLGDAVLGNAGRATAAESSSTIFISDAISEGTSTQSPEASADGSIVFIEDAPPQATALQTPALRAPVGRTTINLATIKMLPVVATPVQSAGRGELTVVSNQHRQVSALQPLAQREQQGAGRKQQGDVQIAVHTEPAVPQNTQTQNQPTAESATVADLLLSAHQLSLQATTEADYTQIEQECAAALQHGAEDDQAGFATQLSSWALNRRGQLRADEGEQELANADFESALQNNPRNWRAMHNRGVSFAQEGNFAEAFDDFNQVIQLNPKYAKAYANRATLYVQAKDLQAAIKDYENAIQINNQFATAHVGLGRVCHMLSRWDDAIEHYTAAAELEPTSADIFCSRGDLQADRGHYAEALADYARTIELDGDFAHAYRNGAWLLATCPDDSFRDPENALLGAQQALECSYGERHVALDTLAAALASNGQFKEAIATVTQAVDLAPEGAKFMYLSRLQLYQDSQPFRTEPVGEVSQAAYEASDQ